MKLLFSVTAWTDKRGHFECFSQNFQNWFCDDTRQMQNCQYHIVMNNGIILVTILDILVTILDVLVTILDILVAILDILVTILDILLIQKDTY
jgi:hypothetical protein